MARIRLEMRDTQGKYATGVKVYIGGEWVQRVVYIENEGIKEEDLEHLEAEGMLWVIEFDADYRLEKYDERGNLKLIVGKPKQTCQPREE